jgi:hypothetical protein
MHLLRRLLDQRPEYSFSALRAVISVRLSIEKRAPLLLEGKGCARDVRSPEKSFGNCDFDHKGKARPLLFSAQF